MLIIPSIPIQNRLCTCHVCGETGTEEFYSRNPVEIAKLWRTENAKVLHVEDLDALHGCPTCNDDVIRDIVRAIDIPVELAAMFSSYDEARHALVELGVYRILVGTLAYEDPPVFQKLITDFGHHRIIGTMDVKDGFVVIEGGTMPTARTAREQMEMFAELGILRVVYRDLTRISERSGPSIDELSDLAKASGLCITVDNTVRDYLDLKALQECKDQRVDSVILGKVLYDNVFPCQKIWRISEKLWFTRCATKPK